MLNVFKHVPGLDKVENDEPTEADLKADRIKFHRESVRNGPVNFRHVTNGQIRRLQERVKQRQARKEYRDKVRRELHSQRFNATLRGQLSVAGVIPVVQDFDLKRQINATVWIVRRFGVSVERVDGPAYASFERDDVVTALSAALMFYNKATGAAYVMPDDFEPAIYEVATVNEVSA